MSKRETICHKREKRAIMDTKFLSHHHHIGGRLLTFFLFLLLQFLFNFLLEFSSPPFEFPRWFSEEEKEGADCKNSNPEHKVFLPPTPTVGLLAYLTFFSPYSGQSCSLRSFCSIYCLTSALLILDGVLL